MYKGYNKIFWGILITTFNINVGKINLLPSFIGFIFISNGINILYKKTNIDFFNKAKIFAIILSIINLIEEVIKFLSFNHSDFFIWNQLGIVFCNVLKLFMVYKLFEGSIKYINNNIDSDLALENTKKLKFYIIASTVTIIALNLRVLFNESILNNIVFFMLFVLNIYLALSINHIKKMF